MPDSLSREYLEEVFRELKGYLPGWLYATLRQRAMSRAGGRSAHRVDDPSVIEKLALSEIRPRALRELDDTELRAIWLRLGQWFKNFTRRKQPVEGVVNAALWALDEMAARKISVEDNDLTRAVAALQETRKASGLDGQIESLPKDLVVVRDFVSVVGSSAKRAAGDDVDAKDLDVLIRAPWDTEAGQIQIQSENIWLPLRNVLDAQKEDKIHWIANAQGAHGDHIPLYDLVLRKKATARVEIMKSGLPTNALGWTSSETLTRVVEQERKFFKTEAVYVEPASEAERVCGTCRHFQRRPGDPERGTCEVVEGDVAWFGTSNLFISAEDEARAVFALRESAEAAVLALAEDGVEKSATVGVPTTGPEGAPVAFVGASPDKVARARREPFIGPTGSTMIEKYLEPLGLGRSEVVLTNAVPELLIDADGKVREPTADEVAKSKEWLTSELDRLKPRVVVALGKTAKEALGNRVDLTMPHPSAVRRFGDSGEVGRKIKQLSRLVAVASRVEKQKPAGLEEGGEETRGASASKEWFDRWPELLPSSGKGRFVYQHHWRGIEEGETGLTDAQLLNTTHSLHGDLRLEGDDGLFGWAVLVGAAAENKGGDKFLTQKLDDPKKLRAAVKLQQPKAWLDVGVKKPFVVEPGGPGATSNKAAKFFALDKGTYRLGVVRRSAVEIFLDGSKLNGRYILQLAEVDEGAEARRFWLIDKPEEQTAIADRRDLADVIGELRRKRQKFLVWAKPGERPRKIDVRTGRVIKGELVPIIKADKVKRIVYGAVLDPYDKLGAKEDAHDDWMPPAQVESTQEMFTQGDQVIGLHHKKKGNAQVVENWIVHYPEGHRVKAMRNQPHHVYRIPFGSDFVHSGSWMLGVKLGPAEWQDYQAGKINAFSPSGLAYRVPIARSAMPKVTIVELVPKLQAS